MDFINITGASQNNLKNIDVNIPKHLVTVFTGRSGSGKSSLVFNTVAADSISFKSTTQTESKEN